MEIDKGVKMVITSSWLDILYFTCKSMEIDKDIKMVITSSWFDILYFTVHKTSVLANQCYSYENIWPLFEIHSF